MAPSLQIHQEDSAACLASFGNLFMAFIFGPITVAHVEKIQVIVPLVHRAGSTGKALSLTVVRLDKADINKQLRDKLNETLQRYTDKTIASANVINGPAFAAAAVRAAMTAMFLVSRSSYPTKNFAMGGEAIAWLLGYADPQWSSADKVACTQHVLRLQQKLTAVGAAS